RQYRSGVALRLCRGSRQPRANARGDRSLRRRGECHDSGRRESGREGDRRGAVARSSGQASAGSAICTPRRRMNVSAIFVRKLVMTSLLMAALVIFGAFGYANLPVSELPSVDFPTIVVSASLPGADPQTVASSIASPLESQFLTIPDVASMTSQSVQG